jgi:hypothetical protein
LIQLHLGDEEGEFFGKDIAPLVQDLPGESLSNYSAYIGEATYEKVEPVESDEEEPPYALAVAPKVTPETKAALEEWAQVTRTPEFVKAYEEFVSSSLARLASDIQKIDQSTVIGQIYSVDQRYEEKSAFFVSWGVSPGDIHLIPPIRFGKIASYLENSPSIAKIVEIAGRMAKDLMDVIARSEEQDDPDYGNLGPVDFTDDPMAVLIISPEAFAASVMARRDPKYRPWSDFEMHRVSRGDYLGMLPPGKKEKRGGFVCAVDNSGSMTASVNMAGCPAELAAELGNAVTCEDVSKAIALALASVATNLGYPFSLIMFSDGVSPQMRVTFNEEKMRSLKLNDRLDVIEQCLAWAAIRILGGTSFDSAVKAIIESIEEMDVRKIDGIMVTDGQCSLSQEVVNAWKERQNEFGTKLLSMVIGAESTGSIEAISESVTKVRRMGDFFSEIVSFGRMVVGTPEKPEKERRPIRFSAF